MVDNPKRESRGVRSRAVSRGADVVLVTVRELRLLLGLLLILFITSETWRYVGRLTVFRVVGFACATLIAALLVVGIGLRRILGRSGARRATVRVALELLAFGTLLFVTFTVVGVLSVDAELASCAENLQIDVVVAGERGRGGCGGAGWLGGRCGARAGGRQRGPERRHHPAARPAACARSPWP